MFRHCCIWLVNNRYHSDGNARFIVLSFFPIPTLTSYANNRKAMHSSPLPNQNGQFFSNYFRLAGSFKSNISAMCLSDLIYWWNDDKNDDDDDDHKYIATVMVSTPFNDFIFHILEGINLQSFRRPLRSMRVQTPAHSQWIESVEIFHRSVDSDRPFPFNINSALAEIVNDRRWWRNSCRGNLMATKVRCGCSEPSDERWILNICRMMRECNTCSSGRLLSVSFHSLLFVLFFFLLFLFLFGLGEKSGQHGGSSLQFIPIDW